MVMDSNIDFSLDMDEINAQIEIESLMPAVLVSSAYKIVSFQMDDGTTGNRDVWQLEWKRLDMDLGDMLYRSSHNLPDPNSEKPVTQRGRLTYVQQVTCFNKLGVGGKQPQDFLDQRHWIRETIVGQGRFQKSWWKSEALYVEGQSYDEAMGNAPSSVDMNPPTDEKASITENTNNSESVELNEDSPYTLFLTTVNGLAHRQAIAAVEKVDSLKENEEIMNGVKSGAIFDEMIDQGLLKDEEGKYVMVS